MRMRPEITEVRRLPSVLGFPTRSRMAPEEERGRIELLSKMDPWYPRRAIRRRHPACTGDP